MIRKSGTGWAMPCALPSRIGGGDEPLAFHNAQTWGSRADWEGPDLWGHPDSVMDKKLKEQELLEQGFCPFDETPIKWGGLMSVKLLVERWEPLGAGYWRYTVDSMFSAGDSG